MAQTQATKAMAEQSMWQFAHTWHKDLGLTLHGVDLGDSLEYDVLRVLGGVWKQHLDAAAAAAESAPAAEGQAAA